MPSLTRETVAHHTGAGERRRGPRAGRTSWTWTGVAERVAQPCLVVTGERWTA